MTRASVVVVGAGIAGLAAAWELTGGAAGPNNDTPRVEVIDSATRVGGSLVTTTFADRVVDLGADGFLARRPEAVQLIHELGLEDQLISVEASGATVFLQGALRAMPAGLVLGVPTDLSELLAMKGLSRRARLDARRDTLFPARLHVGDDATIGSITRAKLGRELTYSLIEPMIGGIQAGRVDELSARSVFPALLDAARAGGSLMRALRPPPTSEPNVSTTSPTPLFQSLRQGVGSLPVELARQLIARGVVLRLNTAVTTLRRTPAGSYPWEVDTLNTTTPANAVVLAAAAPVAAKLLGSLDAALARLASVRSASAAMITCVVAQENVTLPERGTGVLVPLNTPWRDGQSMLTTAVTFLDRKWSRLRREGEVLVRVHVGRSDDTRWQALEGDALVERVVDELGRVLPRFLSPRDVLIQRWPDGLPQYEVGHETLVVHARDAAKALGVTLAGSAYDGVGVPACIRSGKNAGSSVLNSE